MMLKFAIVLVLLCFGSVASLICETCDGDTCYDKDRWVQEICPPSTQFCYRLSSKGRAFRRGCSDYPCLSMPGVESDMDCRTCSQDRCNNERDSFFHQRGGGVSWKSSSRSTLNFITYITGSLLIFLNVFDLMT